MITKLNLQYSNGLNLLFLDSVLTELAKNNIKRETVLYRTSELENIERILEYGTDREGFPEKKIWMEGNQAQILHENVIYATTEEEIRRGETDKSFSTSLKKFDIIKQPLLLVYDSTQFMKIKEKQYLFKEPNKKKDALLAIIIVDKVDS